MLTLSLSISLSISLSLSLNDLLPDAPGLAVFLGHCKSSLGLFDECRTAQAAA